jgi:hypothetical protein
MLRWSVEEAEVEVRDCSGRCSVPNGAKSVLWTRVREEKREKRVSDLALLSFVELRGE